jgi:mannose-6-phosphate isomerase
MTRIDLTEPIVFEPLFMERIWGGRRLASRFGKNLPRHGRFGESWEMVDRPEAQSVVRDGPLRGKTLHELWSENREKIFGQKAGRAPRFPLLIKILDARDKLSLQVHPPAAVAAKLGGEPKTEFWYIAEAFAGSALYVGLRQPTTRPQFEAALRDGTAADLLHHIPVQAGDAMFLPSGRFHAIGAGPLLVEIQQNSDTTYRVFDWNRTDEAGHTRPLHVNEALQSIDFNDCQPALVKPDGELLVRHELFEIQKWSLAASREIVPTGEFAIVCCLRGAVRCTNVELRPGEFCLVPAQFTERTVAPAADGASLLRITIPG